MTQFDEIKSRSANELSCCRLHRLAGLASLGGLADDRLWIRCAFQYVRLLETHRNSKAQKNI